MILKKWKDIPFEMRNDSVKKYYDILDGKRFSLGLKRIFDIVASALMMIIMSPLFVVIAILIKCDSKGPVFFRQERVTQYGAKFRIFKFRTMVYNQQKSGTLVTVNNDSRITKVGRVLRRYRLDEIAQLIDVFRGKMTFVGTRPEVTKYANQYSQEMLATLLLPAGITSLASIMFKDEDKILGNSQDVESEYIEKILPQKMHYNLQSIVNYSFLFEIKIMLKTIFAVFEKDADSPIEVKDQEVLDEEKEEVAV